MKKNLLLNVQSLIAATIVSFTAGIQPLSAQSSITLNKADFSIPTWTKLLRTSKATDGKLPYSINMTLNGDPTTSLGFAWFTNPTSNKGMVQIVKKADATEKDFESSPITKEATIENVSMNYLVDANYVDAGIASKTDMSYTCHKVLVDKLDPGTTYSFRVGTTGAWSEIGSFTTAKNDKSAYSFIYITDTQAQNDEMFDVSQKTIHAAQRLVPDAQFVLCNGDFVETTGATNASDPTSSYSSEWEWEQWFSTMQDVWMHKPLVPVQGNHDRSVRDSNFAKHFNTDNSFNENSPAKTAMNGTVYSFVYGDALFLAINYEDYSADGYFDALKAWMREQVKAHPEVKWRIATYHKNMFTGSNSHQDDVDGKIVRAAMLPIFDELKIDLALQGHDHIYEVIGPVSNTSKTLVSAGVQNVEVVGQPGARENMTGKKGGVFNVKDGTLYFLNNSAGKKKYEPRNEATMLASLEKHEVTNYWGLFSGKFGQTGEPTFSRVNLSTDKIEIETYTVNDLGEPSLFDSFTVVKDNATANTSVLKSAQVTVAPNPASDVIRINGVTADKVELFSMDGDLVKMERSSNEMNVSSLPVGMYVVKITSGNDLFFSKVMKK